MKKRGKTILAKLLVFAMILQMAIPMNVFAAPISSVSEIDKTFTGTDYLGKELAMINIETGKAVRIDKASVKADADVEAATNGVKAGDSANFTITKHSSEEFYAVNNTKKSKFLKLTGFDYNENLLVEVGDGQQSADGLNQNAWEGLVVEETGTAGQYLLETTARYNITGAEGAAPVYIKVNSNAVLGVTAEKAQATKFCFSPIVDALEEQVTEAAIKDYVNKPVALFTDDNKAVRINYVNEVVKLNGTVEAVEGGVKASANSVFYILGSTDNDIYGINNANAASEDTKCLKIEGDRLWWGTGFYDNPGSGAWEAFSFEYTDETKTKYYVTDENKSLYATVDDSGLLKTTTDKAMATAFQIAVVKETLEDTADPADPIDYTKEFTIKNKANNKFVKTYENDGDALTVDGEETDTGVVFKVVFGICDTNILENPKLPTVSLVSKDFNKGTATVAWTGASDNPNGAAATFVKVHSNVSGSGWETIRIIPNGDGTVSFKDSYFDQYITVAEEGGKTILKCRSDKTKDTLTDNEKFIIHYEKAPDAIASLAIDEGSRTQTTLDLSWDNPASIYTNIKVLQKGPEDLDFVEIADLGDETTYQVTGLTPGATYAYKLRFVNGNGNKDNETYCSESNEVSATTRAGEKPATPANIRFEDRGDKALISWDAAEKATGYKIVRAKSMFGTYEDTGVSTTELSAEVTYSGNKYEEYYCVVAMNGTEESEKSDYVSLEKEMFGDHTLIFAPTDDTAKIDETLQKLFDETNDRENDAQFNGAHWQIYFKPGDYTGTSCINLGFYTAINGLGKTPYDVRLNNVAIPAYLGDNNATCNFWRSMENVSIINTGNSQGEAQGSWRANWFNWAVAQAAPLRRVYSERPVAYDWNYGWASGGYVADCYFKGIDGEGNTAGTWSGQQFYTRNIKADGNVFGTTLNNFFQGVEAPNLPNADGVAVGNAVALKSGQGYSNWKIPNGKGEQQVFTNIEKTKKIAEKPFLYIDDAGKYQVFVPAVKENTKGTSWSETGMGEGKDVSLDTFYIAKPTDTAKKINEQLDAGKNIYFTPGIYHAEETIKVTKADTILLGTGLATIIPDNQDAAVRIADVDGVRISGLIFDAGESSAYLLVVGEQGAHNDHSANPTVLQDLFFRVGGTTDKLTKAENALEINSDDVIGDHFWIWRADHGAGVAWYGNESKHGLIVNGDDVICYALFNEHFQDYTTLWNGENGATYFYQNETAYDPISQEEWMSHDGTVNGYASYKVADNVKNHYAVGLGIYNVFIYTGPTYDSTKVQIRLDNAIEVPDTPNVLVENACLQTFADEKKVLQKINSIVNGMGDPVSSGIDPVTGETGTAWDRAFLRYYCNGEAEGSYRNLTSAYKDLKETYNTINEQLENIADEETKKAAQEALDKAKEALDKYEMSVEWPIKPETEDLVSSMREIDSILENLGKTSVNDNKIVLKMLIEECSRIKKGKYTEETWAAFQTALSNAKVTLDNAEASEEDVTQAINALNGAKDALEENDTPAPGEEVDKLGLSTVIARYKDLQQGNYTDESWQAFKDALAKAEEIEAKADATQEEVDAAKAALEKAVSELKEGEKPVDPNPPAEEKVGLWAEDIEDVTYTGTAIKPVVNVYDGATLLTKKDYTVSYKNNTKVGEATITIKGKGNYTGTITKNFKIVAKDLGDEDIVIDDLYVMANKPNSSGTAKAVTPNPVVKRNGKKLKKGTDYMIKLPDTSEGAYVKPGTYEVEIVPAEKSDPKFVCGYTGKKVITITLADSATQVLMSKVSVAKIPNQLYTGSEIKPQVSVTYKGQPLEETDYTVEYSNDNDYQIGSTTTVKVIGKGTYVGVKAVTFKVTGTTLKAGNVSLVIPEGGYYYDGTEKKPVVVVQPDRNSDPLREGTDYTVEYRNNTNTGSKATVIVKGINNYTGTIKKNFKIGAYNILDNTDGLFKVVSEDIKVPYAKGAAKPEVELTFNGKALTKDTDYTLSWSNNSKLAGKDDTKAPTITIKGKGNYTGNVKVAFTIEQQDIGKLNAKAADRIEKNAGKYNKVNPVITDLDGKVLKKGSDYNITGYTYQDGTEIGENNVPAVGSVIRVNVEGINKYTGTAFAEFRIIANDKNIASAKIVVETQQYSGKEIKPAGKDVTVTVKVKVDNRTEWKQLEEGKEYEIVEDGYSRNINRGTAKLTIRGIGEYGGTKTGTFKITAQTMNWADWYENATSWLKNLFK